MLKAVHAWKSYSPGPARARLPAVPVQHSRGRERERVCVSHSENVSRCYRHEERPCRTHRTLDTVLSGHHHVPLHPPAPRPGNQSLGRHGTAARTWCRPACRHASRLRMTPDWVDVPSGPGHHRTRRSPGREPTSISSSTSHHTMMSKFISTKPSCLNKVNCVKA